jgi:predicted deacylase
MRPPIEIAGETVRAGTRRLIDIPIARLSNHTPVSLPVHVIHGRRPGPALFISAAIHGDEILGVEIIRRVLNTKGVDALRGTLLCVPIVNAFGFLAQTRYLPDRRDLNRVFPGSPKGSLAGRLAHLFLNEVAARCDLGIDLHTGAINRSNLPQIRGDFLKPELRHVAESFGVPVILQSGFRDGSLRQAAYDLGVDVLTYEAGEALRLDELSVRAGVRGILQVMHELGMLGAKFARSSKNQSVFAGTSQWVRAPEGGIFRAFKTLGDRVAENDVIGVVTNPYEGGDTDVRSTFDGVIIGRTNISVVNRADALFNVASVTGPDSAEGRIERISSELERDQAFDEEEIA